MDITSIDNMYEDDGIANLAAFVGGLNAEPAGPTKRMLVAIVPEYEHDAGDPGRILRLDALTCDVTDPGGLDADEAELMEAALLIVQKLKLRRAAALAKLDAETITVTKET